jgi:hypothetical protein
MEKWYRYKEQEGQNRNRDQTNWSKNNRGKKKNFVALERAILQE